MFDVPDFIAQHKPSFNNSETLSLRIWYESFDIIFYI